MEGSPPSTLTLDRLPPSPPCWGWGRYTGCSTVTLLGPRHLASPTSGVAGEPAVPAGCQLTHPRPYSSPRAPTWASVVRGEGARAVKTTSPSQQPAVIAADFTTLYDRCLASGLKARVVFSHAAGRQTLTVSCSFPAPAETSVATGRCRRRHRRRRRRSKAATDKPDAPARATPSTAVPPCCFNDAAGNTHAVAWNRPSSREKTEETKKQGGTPAGLWRE